MPKKIIIISSSIFFIETFMSELIEKLGNTCQIYILSNTNCKSSFLTKKFNFIHIPFKRKPSIFIDFLNIPKTIFNIYKIKPNLIITCTPKIIFYGIFISIFTRTNRIHIYTGVYWELFKGFKKKIFLFLDKIYFKFCYKIFFDSKYQINFFKKNGFNPVNFNLISGGSIKGVNLNIFYKNDKLKLKLKSKYNIPNSSKIILYLGRLDPNKGIILLLDAYKDLIKKNSNYFLVFVGKDEININNILKKYKTPQSKILVFPHTSNPEKFYNLCDVICIPSLREGFGSVAIEASACEVPIISSDILGLSESIIDKLNGLKFSLNNHHDLSSKIDLILNNNLLSSQLGKKGREYIKKNYDSNKVIDDFYKQILNCL